jgi:transcriptional regulator with XRE-family HTH domain
VTPDQMKAARKLLGWNQIQLGVYSGTSIHMVRMFERMGHVAKLYGRTEQVDTIAVIRAALEAAGIEFTTGRMPGARLREPAGIE